MTTPLWVPLVVAALGLISTVVGIVVTQIMANRRERASWQRDTEREQQRWQREDEQLTFEHRRTAYNEFFEALRRMQIAAYNHGMGLTVWDTRDLPEGWHTEAFERLQQLEFYGSQHVSMAANIAYSETWLWGDQTKLGIDDGKFYGTQEHVDELTSRALQAIRDDLKIPDEPGKLQTGPGRSKQGD